MLKLILQEDVGKELYGIDLSEKMLHVAKSKLPEQVKLLLGDSEALPFPDNTFDVVYCNDSFHHYPAPMNVLREVHRVLKPGGTFLMGDCWQPLVGRIIMNFYMRHSKEGMSRFTPKQKLFLCFQNIFAMYRGSRLEILRVLLWAKND